MQWVAFYNIYPLTAQLSSALTSGVVNASRIALFGRWGLCCACVCMCVHVCVYVRACV